MMVARNYRIRGRVQGVGYRYFTARVARELGVCGWVRNRADGDVEAYAEAEKDVLDRFRTELQSGPAHSGVDEVTEEAVSPTGKYSSFDIRG
jgi:acylphosphatase